MLTPRDESILREMSRVLADLARDSTNENSELEVVLAGEGMLILSAVIRMLTNTQDNDALVQLIGVMQDFVTKSQPTEHRTLYGGTFRTDEQKEKQRRYSRDYYHNKVKKKPVEEAQT